MMDQSIDTDETSTTISKSGWTSSLQRSKIVGWLIKWRFHPWMRGVVIRTLLPILVFITIHLMAKSVPSPPSTHNDSSHSTSISPIVIILLLGLGLGELFALARLPPLLGMLVAGLFLRNVGGGGQWEAVDVTRINPHVATLLRQVALVVILIRAGLGLDPEALLRLKGVVLRLAFCPCLAEALTVAVATHFILNFPWLWALLLGFVLAAVSPAVVVPCLLSLRERGYGVSAGIPTILIAASSVDDILAISGFGLVLASIFAGGSGAGSTSEGTGGSVVGLILQGPLELGAGLGFGVIWGSLLGWFFAHRDKPGEHSALITRIILTLFGGITALLASQQFDLPGSGPLGCLTATFVAAIFWRRAGVLGDTCTLNGAFSSMWYIFQPLLFGLIGTEIDLRSLEPPIIIWGLLVLLIGLIIRIVVTYWVVGGAGLNIKERLFVAIAWIPKATVQAAIGPIALDTARSSSSENIRDDEDLGLKVLTIAILAILITAPIGSMAITLLGPKLLSPTSSQTHNGKNSHKKEDDEEDEDGTSVELVGTGQLTLGPSSTEYP